MKRFNIIISLILILSVMFSVCVHAAPVVLPDDPLHEPLAGDLNQNGTLDTLDYLLTKRHVMGTFVLSDVQFEIADVDKNGVVSVLDYTYIKRKAMGQ